MGTQLLERINADQEKDAREKEELVEGYEMGDKKRQEMLKETEFNNHE